ncbi:LysR family transcriptional regulator [Desulfonema ishimotonii]|uniref:LysR family transcriptional regulator n=1 Tax=Desulfonema ishimotonii TaxID=45657 RepID=A0A401FZ72_9BACT|nr:LysR family transcriptional regulator [Desulfonema ishimotonii]GBC62264.1 LysR family transcriptional regulator [Desulfonema ishimotonii]
MELRQLRYFMAVAEERHFGRAAKRVCISQPPLSMQIRNLEAEIGVQLFRRTTRRVELTEAGAAFLREVRSVTEKLEAAVETARRVAGGAAGRISVGFVGPAMDAFLPGVIREFREHAPGVILSLAEMDTRAQLDALGAGRIQAGFVRLFRHELPGLRAEPIFREPYVLAFPPGHRLADYECVPLAALKGEPMILYPRQIQPALYDRIMAACAEAGFSPDIVQEAVTKKTTLALVAAGLGLALVPESSAQFRPADLLYRPVSGPLPMVEIALVRKKDAHAPALDRFIRIARKYKRRVGQS